MFQAESIQKIDPVYFNIIMADDCDVTIQSRNTGHYWYCIAPVFRVMRRVSYSINTSTVIPITSTGVETASDRRFGAYRAMTGGR